MPRTTREFFEELRPHLLRVPRHGQRHVCRICLGAVGESYEQCYACYKLLVASEAPRSLQTRIVPMSIVRNPGTWYSILQGYKKGAWAEHAPLIASLSWEWMRIHEEDVGRLLEGDVDLISVVPSKKWGVTFDSQFLVRALRQVSPLGTRLAHVLDCHDRECYGRTKYAPEMFSVDGRSVAGKRVLLIEDSWITGATAVSAAGALLGAGARAVVISPIARDFKVEFHTADHPYASLIAGPYDLRSWPR